MRHFVLLRGFLTFYWLPKGKWKLFLPHPLHAMLCRCSSFLFKQQTLHFWMEERGRGVDSFVLNNFVADFCRHYNTPRSILTTPENTITYHNACSLFLLGVKMGRRETENNVYAKFWGDKQRALWYVSMVFLEWSILLHDSHALGKKLHSFHDSIVSQFPEKTWAQTKRNIEIWPESLRVMLEFWHIERALFSNIKFGKYLIVISRFSSLIFFLFLSADC